MRPVTIVCAGGLVLASGGLLIEARAVTDAPRPAEKGAGRQALVGEWALNVSLSDDLRAKLREGWPDGGGRRGPGRRGSGGGWGGGGRRGAPGGGGDRDGGGPPGVGPSRPLALTAERLTIANLEPEITMLEPDGNTRRLHADGKGYRDSSGAEVKTRWDDAVLVVETNAGRRQSKETWSVAGEPRRLTVQLEIDRPFGGTVKVKRVFDPALAAPQVPPPAAAPAASATPDH